MNDNTMPAIEAEGQVDREPVAYELAFHVLPTVAEGEVATVFSALSGYVTAAGGTIFDSEAPQRFDLAYEIVKYLEGRNRRFGSAYFGWVRFRLDPAAVGALTEELEANKQLLRYLLVRLTKEEEAAPFRFHEALATTRVSTITDEDMVADPESVVEADETEKVAGDDETVDTPSEVAKE
jgi:ribosomal protein S6